MSGATAKVGVTVAIAPESAFEFFTRDIDRWWRRGIKFRNAASGAGFIALEPGVGGRLFESFDGERGPHIVEVGKIRVWDPPRLLVFSWRNANFAPDEHTEVEVAFLGVAAGTLVTVTHRGLTELRPDHPARHGLANDAFIRMIGLWWGEQMTSLREFSSAERSNGAGSQGHR